MAIEVQGKTIKTDNNGNLVNPQDWNQDVAEKLATEEDIELTQEHWDVLEYLRDEYLNNNGSQPMERQINKDMGKHWGKKIGSKDLYKLFPKAPSKQGNKIAGLPFMARKGGY